MNKLSNAQIRAQVDVERANAAPDRQLAARQAAVLADDPAFVAATKALFARCDRKVLDAVTVEEWAKAKAERDAAVGLVSEFASLVHEHQMQQARTR